jgi:hypothetical protein
MIVRRVRSSCDDTKTCPALHQTDRDTVLVQGWEVTDCDVLARLGLPGGTEAVEVPATLLAEALYRWPALQRTDRDTVIIAGTAVTDADALRQLRLPAGERAVEVPADLLAEVLKAC